MLVVIRENEVNFALNQIFLQRLEIWPFPENDKWGFEFLELIYI